MNKNRTMKAMAIKAYGNEDQFELMEVPFPEVKSGELLIRVAYAGLNPADWKYREGFLAQHVNIPFPGILGNDFSGIVVEVGEGVTDFAPGDKVFGFTNIYKGSTGSYAEYVAVDQNMTVKVPDNVSLKSAAVLPTAGNTSWQNMFYTNRGSLQKGHKVFINGGSGGLGSFAIQYAKWIGAEVATTTGKYNIDYVRSLGAELVIDYQNQDISSELKKWAPKGVDLVLDLVGAKSLPNVLDMITTGGKLVNIPTMDPNMDGDVPKQMEEAAQSGVTKIYDFPKLENFSKDITQVVNLLAEGSIKDPAIEVFDFENVADAHKKMQTGKTHGKLVLEVGGESIN
ncbi:NADP-dependent oxidoreductase [Labilibacter sediminis]|nr:NADP-dependent oxidoreductase [Labilibacter sediminis]